MEKITPQDIFEIMKQRCCFNFSTSFYETDVQEFVVEPLRKDDRVPSFFWNSGASKAVLVFNDLDFVIKIPFTGDYDEENDYCHCEFCEAEEDSSKCENCPYKINDGYPENSFKAFTGANAFNKSLPSNWNYCAVEADLTEKAATADLDICFARTYYLGSIDGHPIYWQEKADIYACGEWGNNSTVEERKSVMSTCHSMNAACFNIYWLCDVMKLYGANFLKDFLTFVTENHIDDLHGDNIGYIDGLPVLVDYSSYRR